MINQKNNSTNSSESDKNKNISNIIMNEETPKNILFPKYNQYNKNLNILILYRDGMFLNVADDNITIKLVNDLSMFFRKPFDEEEYNILVKAIDDTFSYFFNCLDKNHIEYVKSEIISIYKKEAYYNLLIVREHIHNTLTFMQKANQGLNRLDKYYKSYWKSELNDEILYNIQTNNAIKINMMNDSKYLKDDITKFEYNDDSETSDTENRGSGDGDGDDYENVFLDDDLSNKGITYQYSDDENSDSDNADDYIDYEEFNNNTNTSTIMESMPTTSTYLTENMNSIFYYNPNTNVHNDDNNHDHDHDHDILIDNHCPINNGEIDDDEIDYLANKGDIVNNGCNYIGDELHEYFDVESNNSCESLELSVDEKIIGEDMDYIDYVEQEVTEESERMRQEFANRQRQERERKEQLHLILLRKIKYGMRVVCHQLYNTWVYIKDSTISACNYISDSFNNWYYGNNKNTNKAKYF